MQPDGSGVWKLTQGEVALRPLKESGQQVALEIHLPLYDKADLAREALARACELAKEAEARVFDPQLGHPVSFSDENKVAEQYTRTARYATEMLGVAEAMPLDLSTGQERRGFQLSTRTVLIIIGILIVLFRVLGWVDAEMAGE